MVEFSAAAELDVGIAPGALQDARRQIENELGDVTVGVSGSAAPSGQPRDPATGQFASPMGSEEYERRDLSLGEDRNALLEDIADAMDDVVGGGFGGGGGVPGGGGGGGGGRGGLLSLLGGGVGGAGVAGAGVLAAGFGAAAIGGNVAREGARRFIPGGDEVIAGRERFTGLSGIGNAFDDPAGFLGNSFKQMIDPTGVGEMAGQALVNEASQLDIETPSWVNDLLGWEPQLAPGDRPNTDATGATAAERNVLATVQAGFRPNTDAMGATSTERAILAGRPQERDPRLTGQDIGFQGVNVEVNVGDNGGNARRDAERIARREADRAARRIFRELDRKTPGAGTQPRTRR